MDAWMQASRFESWSISLDVFITYNVTCFRYLSFNPSACKCLQCFCVDFCKLFLALPGSTFVAHSTLEA